MASPIVKRYLLAVSRYPWLLPAGLALGLAGASFVSSQPDPPPTHLVEAILTGNRPATVFSATGVEVRQPIESVTTDGLLTEEIVQQTAAEVDLDPTKLTRNLKVTLPSAAVGKDKKAAGDAIEQIKIEYRDGEERRARKVIEGLVKRIVKQSQETNASRLKAVITSLNQRLPDVKADMAVAEQALERYDRLEGPALIAAQNGSLGSAILQSEQQQRSLQVEGEGVNAEIASLQQKLGLNADQAYVSSALSADPIIANLRAQIHQAESQLAIAAKDLRPEHPTIVQLTKQRQAYEEQLRQRAQEVVGGGGLAAPFQANVRSDSSLDPERQRLALRLVELTTLRERILRQQASLLQTQISLRSQLKNLPNKQLARGRLEDQLKLKKALHDQMQAKLVDAQTAEAETVSSLTVARLSQIPQEPKPPKNVPLMVIVGGVIGVILGGGIIFLLDMLEGICRTEEELRDLFRDQEVPLLGSLPWLPHWDLPGASVLPADSPYLEPYERFRSNLRLAEGQRAKLVLVTSPIAREGKSVVAYHLAIAAARSGKRTLLLEADLRSESQAAHVGVAVDAEHRIEPLRYYGQIANCIQLVPQVQNLYLVPSPGVQRQPAVILESSEWKRLLEDVRGRFDFIVVDSPALSHCNDALLLAPYTDGLILVSRPGVTQPAVLNPAIEQLNESENFRFLGAVIHGIELPAPPIQSPPVPPARSKVDLNDRATRAEEQVMR
jgi:capsular exopolysaccharide synthesis family protein